MRKLFEILLNQTQIRLYLPSSSDWCETKRNSVWFQIYWKMVNKIWFRFDLIIFRKKFSVCICQRYNSFKLVVKLIVNFHISTDIFSDILVKILSKVWQFHKTTVKKLNMQIIWDRSFHIGDDRPTYRPTPFRTKLFVQS